MRWGLGIVMVAIVAGVVMMVRGNAQLSLAGVIEPETTAVPTTNWALSIDCDAETPAIDAACTVEAGETVAAAVVLRNISEAARRLESFQVYARADEAVLAPVAGACAFPQTACNPNFNESIGGSLWECDTAADFEAGDSAVALSFMWCLNATDAALAPDDGPVIDAGGAIVLASITYTAGSPGVTALEPQFVTVEDADATQIMSCNPGNVAEGSCDSATVTVFVDSDGDGYSDAAETALGEDPNSYCAIMRADVNGDGEVNSGDLLQVAFGFGAYAARSDQNLPPDGEINSGDLLMVALEFGKTAEECAP